MSFYTALNTFMLILETVRKYGAQSWPGAWPARQFFILLLCEVIIRSKAFEMIQKYDRARTQEGPVRPFRKIVA